MHFYVAESTSRTNLTEIFLEHNIKRHSINEETFMFKVVVRPLPIPGAENCNANSTPKQNMKGTWTSHIILVKKFLIQLLRTGEIDRVPLQKNHPVYIDYR